MPGRVVIFVTLLLGALAWGQIQPPAPVPAPPANAESVPGMDMSRHGMSDTKNTSSDKDDADADTSAPVMHSMEGHMNMGPHMKMTALRPAKPQDAARAERVVEAARQASEKYRDYRVALAEGFKIFHPEIPQNMYHFTNPGYAIEAQFGFHPEHPTSLLYEKHDGDYKLIGVMYTAPKRFTEDQLDERIPLSVAQWHEHVNFCAPPADLRKEMFAAHPRFGLRGSITTQDACDAAGGTFHPVIFNWMVHVYPFAKDQASIWSVERQHSD
jgi:hypothetical protein